MKTLSDVKRHKAVKLVSDERKNGDGIFVYLKDGFSDFSFDNSQIINIIHEQTIQEIINRLSGVKSFFGNGYSIKTFYKNSIIPDGAIFLRSYINPTAIETHTGQVFNSEEVFIFLIKN
jgi:hypothetical protein